MKLDKQTQKYIVIGIGILILLFLLYYVVKKIIDYTNSFQHQVNTDVNSSNLTFAKWVYTQMADTMFTAMDGFGTNEIEIYNVLNQLKNEDDWKQLIAAFGQRKPTYTFYSDDKENLIQWLQDELSDSDKEQVRSILRNKGISVTF